MESKKSPQADLENYRTILVETGLVIGLLLSIFLIEYKTYEKAAKDMGEVEAEIDDEVIPITERQTKPPPPPPPPPPEQIEVVDDEVELEEELDISSSESDEMEEVEEIEMEEETSDEVLNFQVVESVPVFPGCEDAENNQERKQCFQRQIMGYVGRNFKFPDMAKEMGIEGRVYVNFVIEKDGSFSNIKVVRGVDKMIDEEAVRVVKSMPKVKPAKQRGKPVRMSFTLPINAKLQ